MCVCVCVHVNIYIFHLLTTRMFIESVQPCKHLSSNVSELLSEYPSFSSTPMRFGFVASMGAAILEFSKIVYT